LNDLDLPGSGKEVPMNSLGLIRDLYRQMEWADAAVWRTIFEDTASTPAGEDPDLKGLLYHLHLVQNGFLSVWRAEPFAPPEAATLDASGIARWARGYHREVAGFLSGLKESDLDRPAPLPWAGEYTAEKGEEPHSTSLGETLVQVAMHSTHHRGQVCARLRQSGLEPPLVDYIGWLWFGKKAAEWPGEIG
jgi:uncharacterized damage-inducible protein DinB